MASWISNFIRPKVKRIGVTKETTKEAKQLSSNTWTKCPKCDHVMLIGDIEKNLHVCTRCDHHMRMPVEARLDQIYGKGNYKKIDTTKTVVDPLKFKDMKKYLDRLKQARAKTKQDDAMTVATGKVMDYGLVTAVLDFNFMGGSMGGAVGQAFVEAANLAEKENAALLLVSASGGARMQEGAISLMQLPRTVLAINRLKGKSLPYIVLLCDPTTGGVTASIAMLGDMHLAEPKALIGFAGQRVIKATSGVDLPEGFQSAEFLVEHGFVDQVVTRSELHERIKQILNILMSKRGSSEPLTSTFDTKQFEASEKHFSGIGKQKTIPDTVITNNSEKKR